MYINFQHIFIITYTVKRTSQQSRGHMLSRQLIQELHNFGTCNLTWTKSVYVGIQPSSYCRVKISMLMVTYMYNPHPASNLTKAWFTRALTKGTRDLTSSRREYYIFFGPLCGVFSVKIRKKFLAINNFSVNETKSRQPNKCLFSLTFRELNG